MLPSSYGSVGTADLALLSSQRYGDEPRFIESIEINATPSNSPPPVPKSASTTGSGVRTTRSTAGPVEGTLGLFPSALARSPMLRAAFHELVDLWQLDQETLLELQECVRRCEYQAGDIVVEQVPPAPSPFDQFLPLVLMTSYAFYMRDEAQRSSICWGCGGYSC